MSKIGDKICIDNGVYTASITIDTSSCTGCDAEYDAVLCDKITTIKFCNRDIIWIKQQPVETQTTTCNQTKGESEMNTAKTDKTDNNTGEEPKYTLAEFLEAYNAYVADNRVGTSERDSYILKYLECKYSPEYQEFLRIEKQYLELKQKFS